METDFFLSKPPRLFAHRGASYGHPENTIEAFDAARDIVQYFEFDIWFSREGVPVIHHDESALRTCGLDLKISELSLDELRKLDAGKGFPDRGEERRIPTLEELCARYPDHFFNIEIKQDFPKGELIVYDILERHHKAGHALLASGEDSIMEKISNNLPQVPRSMSSGEILKFYLWVQDGGNGQYCTTARALQIPVRHGDFILATPKLISLAHKMNIEVHFWTVNDEEEIKRLLNMGADGIMTDRPECAYGILNS